MIKDVGQGYFKFGMRKVLFLLLLFIILNATQQQQSGHSQKHSSQNYHPLKRPIKRRNNLPNRRDSGKQLVKALQKAEAQLEKGPSIGTITNLVLPAQACFLKAKEQGCANMVIPVCGVESRKEYVNCCQAVLAGETKFIRGRCNYIQQKTSSRTDGQILKRTQNQ
eukprot:TRINITY_DN21074_c0_g1_i2.p1 TRINITY_DN21074_c0_g1~~TRINITY_DN21074_c0_g1_i2.p1  ORF type:complete len:166 (-),score=5.88 TRINITY_DN21074_c0_g1_i2:557-1054(-)